jgi:hypothetical protein
MLLRVTDHFILEKVQIVARGSPNRRKRGNEGVCHLTGDRGKQPREAHARQGAW